MSQGGTTNIVVPTQPEIIVGEPNFTMNKEIVSGATGSQAGSVVRWRYTVENSGSTIRQTAIFDPVGLTGLLYWYSLYPIHAVMFRGMLSRIAARAEQEPRHVASLREPARS